MFPGGGPLPARMLDLHAQRRRTRPHRLPLEPLRRAHHGLPRLLHLWRQHEVGRPVPADHFATVSPPQWAAATTPLPACCRAATALRHMPAGIVITECRPRGPAWARTPGRVRVRGRPWTTIPDRDVVRQRHPNKSTYSAALTNHPQGIATWEQKKKSEFGGWAGMGHAAASAFTSPKTEHAPSPTRKPSLAIGRAVPPRPRKPRFAADPRPWSG